EEFASDRGAGLVLAPALGDGVEVSAQFGAAPPARDRLDGGPSHQLEAGFGDPATDHFRVGLAMQWRDTRPRRQRFSVAEPTDIPELGYEDDGHGPAPPGDGLDRLITLVTQLLIDAPLQHHHLTVVMRDRITQGVHTCAITVGQLHCCGWVGWRRRGSARSRCVS